ncbi:hypothetical protein [Amycolatopsis sp. NPDC004625]|uniref:hypothetical protein n=1 Tax=Amycolatopsis sp. NPDC004625 TaxID=3154670 RepID=UPI0033B69AB1
MAARLTTWRIAAAAGALIAGTLSGAVPAQAQELRTTLGDCGNASGLALKYGPVEAVSSVNDNVAGIYLYATPNATCVQGRVLGPPGAEIWLDRCSGANCTGFVGYRTAGSDGFTDTGIWNDNGFRARACGSSGANDHDIVCTSWA